MDIAYINSPYININNTNYNIDDFLESQEIFVEYEIENVFTLPERKFLVMINIDFIYVYIIVDIKGNMKILPHMTLTKEELLTIFNSENEDELSDIDEIYSYKIVAVHPANNGNFIMNVNNVHPLAHPDDRYVESAIYKLDEDEWYNIRSIDIFQYFEEIDLDLIGFIFPNKLSYDVNDILVYLKFKDQYEVVKFNCFRFTSSYKPQAWIDDTYIILIGKDIVFKTTDNKDVLVINDSTEQINTYMSNEGTTLSYITDNTIKIIDTNIMEIIEYKLQINNAKLAFASTFGWVASNNNMIELYDSNNFIIHNVNYTSITVNFEHLRNTLIEKEIQQYLYLPLTYIISNY